MVVLVVVSAYAWRLGSSRFDSVRSVRGYNLSRMLVILNKASKMAAM